MSGYFTALETLLIHWKYGTKFVIITTFLRHPADLPSLHAKTKLLYMQPALAQAIIDGVVPAAQKGMSIDDFVAPLNARPERMLSIAATMSKIKEKRGSFLCAMVFQSFRS